MRLDYRRCAREILEYAGGRENLEKAVHCATRLRLTVTDETKVNQECLEAVRGVKGVFAGQGQLQIIIGMGAVDKVYEELQKLIELGRQETGLSSLGWKMPGRLLRLIGEVFIPILPAITASGMMVGLLGMVGRIWPGCTGQGWYDMLNLISNASLSFLPILIAASSAHLFGGNPYLGAAIGLIMIHPDLMNAWVASHMSPDQIPVWNLAGFSIQKIGYQGHVIPVILSVALMSRLEKWLHRHVPEALDLFVTPLVSISVTAFLALGVLGPICLRGETYMLNAARRLVEGGHGVGSMVMGALYPVTVVGGIHHMYHVIEAGMLVSAEGLNTWMPIASAANFAQGAACLAVGLKTRKKSVRAAAIPAALSAALGITEPAMFGINLRMVSPFICGAAGGAAGALVGFARHIGATSYGVSGIPGFLITLESPGSYALLLAVAFVTAFGLTWIFWKEENRAEALQREAEETTRGEGQEEKEEKGETEALHALSLCAPVSGALLLQEKIPDETFAAGILGACVGIEPEEGVVLSPCDGEVSMTMPTGHALGITSPENMKLLIHVGIDTVKMAGEGFTLLVSPGEQVRAGQPLLRFDREKIREAGCRETVILVLTNSRSFGPTEAVASKSAEAGKPVLYVRPV